MGGCAVRPSDFRDIDLSFPFRSERNRDIVAMYMSDRASISDIAQAFSLSRQRVTQILHAHRRRFSSDNWSAVRDGIITVHEWRARNRHYTLVKEMDGEKLIQNILERMQMQYEDGGAHGVIRNISCTGREVRAIRNAITADSSIHLGMKIKPMAKNTFVTDFGEIKLRESMYRDRVPRIKRISGGDGKA